MSCTNFGHWTISGVCWIAYMMTSSNGNIFRVTGPLCGEFTGPGELPTCAGNSPVPVNSPHKGQWRGALMFSVICVWINGLVNNREAGDLRRHRGHYHINVMFISCLSFVQLIGHQTTHKHTHTPLQWRHNGHDCLSNHQPHDCWLNRLFRRTSKNTSKLRVTGLCAGNSPGTGDIPAQMASNAGNVSIWWRHHANTHT